MKEIKEFSAFFNDDDEFDVILGKTSYYITMQNQIINLIKSYSPLYVLEFGSGSGRTSARIATENRNLSLVAVDNREELIKFCQDKKEYKAIKNLTFVRGDLTKLDSFNFINVDLVLMSYSFNYINDPLETKQQFLEHIFSKMKHGARLIIGDWFLNNVKTFDAENIKQLYKLRVEEGAQSIFWNVLGGKQTEKDIELAHKYLEKFKRHHRNLLKNILERKQVYPVSLEWLVDTAVKVGFKVELNNYINNINDAVVVLKK